MCTAITLSSLQEENFFGRTMDFSYPIDPQFYIIPRDYKWYSQIKSYPLYDNYNFMAIGQEMDDVLAFFDGVNENGFAAAVLYFEGYAQYHTVQDEPEKIPIAAYDFLHYILGKCRSIDDLYPVIKNISLVGVKDPMTQTIAPLHWMATDRSGKAVVIEQTVYGLSIIPNELGAMSNSPDFVWHMENLRNYVNVTPHQTKTTAWGNVELRPFSQGTGTMQLPGGYSSPERFVRAAYLKTHILPTATARDTIIAAFHVMGNVTIPKGVVITGRGTYDYTRYTAFISTKTLTYYFRAYDSDRIIAIRLSDYYNRSYPILLGNVDFNIDFDTIYSPLR